LIQLKLIVSIFAVWMIAVIRLTFPLGQDRERTVPSKKTNHGFAVVWARGI
jgi:hypothetical protein